MITSSHSLLALLFVALPSPARAQAPAARRVPAEWESQGAVWMQWPKGIEATYRPEMAQIINALQAHQNVELLVWSAQAQQNAQAFLTSAGVPLGKLNFHVEPYDWAWMRDNGPVYVECGGQTIAEDWGFDGWGGLVPFAGLDDKVPCLVAGSLGIPCEDRSGLVYERGALEFNGKDTVIASWPVLVDRNPGVSQALAEASFKEAFGVTRVIWLYASPPDDLTKGHVDSICRFIDENTVAVSRFVDQSDPNAPAYEQSAQILAGAGLTVVRIDIPGYVYKYGTPMYTTYVNWLVTDGLVLMGGFGKPAWDAAAKQTVEGFFPSRTVVMVTTLELWYWGGGVHCVTNDQPQLRTALASEVLRVGVPPNPAALLPGQTSLPVLGANWDPVIDHATFMPGATLDLLVVGAAVADLPFGLAGTLLVDLGAAPLLVFGAPGQSFALPVPISCDLIGATFAAQAASLDATGALALTNALDIVIGTK